MVFNNSQPTSQKRSVVKASSLILGAFSTLFWLTSLGVKAVLAEGSSTLTSSGGNRPYLEFRTDSAGGVQRKTIIKVYAEAGETINLGSSAVGIGNGVINYRDPSGNTGSCGTAGLIANRTEESTNSFTPCTVTVGSSQTGVWEIDFVSPSQTSGTNPAAISATANWSQPDNVGYVSAWDVTVKSSAGNPINGRVFTNVFAFNMGSNNVSLSSKVYVLTREGYQYSIDFNGLDPFGFIFFANNNGFLTTSTNTPIFRSLQLIGSNPGSLPTGYSFHNPNNADSSTQVTHKIFLNLPDSNIPASADSPTGTTWLYTLPVAPPAPQNFDFVGNEGTPGQAGTNPLGGSFNFESTVETSYSITLDLNQNGTFGDGNDRTFVGRAVIGSNSVAWNGLDANGQSIPASEQPYSAQINLYAGEAHFPMIDPENNLNGLIIRRENDPSPPVSPVPNAYTVYYNDQNTGSSGSDYSLCASGETGGSCYGTAPSPRSALAGASSQTGAHSFNNNFGDRRGMDTWVYYPSVTLALSGGILIKEADLQITKTDNLTNVDPGDPLTYTITVTNAGPSDVVGALVQDVIPSEIVNVTWSCQITTGNGTCGNANGTGNNISTTVDLENDAVATYTVTGTVAADTSSTLITNTATVTRTNDVNDPNLSNNTASDTTNIIPITGNLTIVKRITAINSTSLNSYVDNTYNNPTTATNEATADNLPNWPTGSNDAGISDFLSGAITDESIQSGDEVEYTIYFLSSGSSPITNVNLCDTIPAHTSYKANSMQKFIDGSMIDLTDTNADSDGAGYFTSSNSSTVPCPSDNNQGAIVVNLAQSPAQIPNATAPGTPTDAYGYIRFRVTVD